MNMTITSKCQNGEILSQFYLSFSILACKNAQNEFNWFESIILNNELAI